MNIIKRVISGEDMQQESSPVQPPRSYQDYSEDNNEDYDDAIGMQIDEDEDSRGNTNQHNNYNNSLEGCNPQPAVVENDMDIVGTSDFHYIASGSMTPRSSLSDVSAAQRLDIDEDAMDEALGTAYSPGEKESGATKRAVDSAWAAAAASSPCPTRLR